MGSDWFFELRLPAGAPSPGSVLRRVYDLAAGRNLRPHRPDGLINLFDADAVHRTVPDLETALAAMATGAEHGQLWTDGPVDITVDLRADRLGWSLDAVHCRRRPVPEADGFRDLHRRLTGLWLDVARDLNADRGRVLDEWSTDQVWALGVHDAAHPVGGWPAELGWWTYLGPDDHRPPPPLPEVAARSRRLANGGLLIALLDDPAAVDPLRYEDLHRRWLRAR